MRGVAHGAKTHGELMLNFSSTDVLRLLIVLVFDSYTFTVSLSRSHFQ